jgi:hypothetical protein
MDRVPPTGYGGNSDYSKGSHGIETGLSQG